MNGASPTLDKPRVLYSKLLITSSHTSGEVVRAVDQCDCACSDRPATRMVPATSPEAVLRCSPVRMQPLPAEYSLLFNPLHDAGVVVLNAPARHVWKQFQQPRSVASLIANIATPDTLLSTVKHLVEAGALEPLNADETLAPPRFGPPTTLSAWLHITNRCNLRCDYCYLNKSAEDMSPDTGRAAIDAVIRSALANHFRRVRLKFAGGEASLNLGRLFELYKYASERTAIAGLEFEAVILSNGVTLSEQAIADLDERGIRVMISLDGIGDGHDAQRKFASGAGSFASVEHTLDRLLTYGVRPFISITLSSRNAQDLPDTVRYVLDRDLPFNINFFRDSDCAASFQDLRLRDDIVIVALRRSFAVIEEQLPQRSLLGMLMDRAQFDQMHNKTCGVGDSYLVIDQNGAIAKCQMEIERPITTIHVEDPLTAIRTDQAGVQNLSVEQKDGCRACEWRYWCAGGCPLLTFRTTGRYDVQSPNCRIYQAIYPDLLRLEALRLMKLVA